MATSNFTANNARAFYVINTHWESEGERIDLDFREILEGIHEGAKSRLNDSERFTEANESERIAGRYEGTICLTYQAPVVSLPGGQTIEAEGRIILRPGYYEAANLDWSYRANIGGCYSHELDSFCCPEDIEGELIQDFADSVSWNEGLIAIHGPKVLMKIQKYLNDLAERLDNVYQTLADEKYKCISRASNGEAFYIPA